MPSDARRRCEMTAKFLNRAEDHLQAIAISILAGGEALPNRVAKSRPFRGSADEPLRAVNRLAGSPEIYRARSVRAEDLAMLLCFLGQHAAACRCNLEASHHMTVP